MRAKVLFLASVVGLPIYANEILPDQFPLFSTEAWVEEAVVTPGESIFVKGAFTEVNGIPRPGLAKLQANGALDLDFAPLEVTDLGLIDEFGSRVIVGWADPPGELFPLSGGRLMRALGTRFEVHQADGAILPNALADLKDGISSITPQFEENGQLWLISRSERNHARIVVRESQSLEPAATFDAPATYPAPPAAVSPAIDGKVWVLGRTYHPGVITSTFGISQQHVLFRINPDGTLDPTFTPEELPNQLLYRFEKSPGPGVILSSVWPGRHLYWPAPTFGSRSFEFRDEGGIQTSESSLSYSFGYIADYVVRGAEVLSFTAGRNDQISTGGSISREAPTQIPIDTANLASLTTALDLFPNGNLLIGGTRRLLNNGSPHPTWQTPRLEGRPTISKLTPLQNGRVLASGDFDFVGGLKRRGGVILHPDGSLDPSFDPDLDLRRAVSMKQKRNGHFLVLMGNEIFDAGGVASRLVELDENGALLRSISLSFAGSEILPDGNRNLNNGTSVRFDLQPDDSIILWVSRYHIEVPTHSVWRIPSNDLKNPVLLSAPANPNGAISLLPDGRLLIGGALHSAEGSPVPGAETLPDGMTLHSVIDNETLVLREWTGTRYRYHLWHPDKGIQRSFDLSALKPQDFWAPGFAPTSRGKLLVTNIGSELPFGFISPFNGLPGTREIARLHPGGRVDPTLKVSADPQGTFLSVLARDSDPSPTIWMAGSFNSLNGIPRQGIAIVADSLASGFQEWMHACSEIASGNPLVYSGDANEDGDTLTNFEEYAAGSDPFRASPGSGLQELETLSWQVPCNPDAPEVLRQIEVSNDLVHWRSASANEIRLETQQDCLTWTLRDNSRTLYSRLRISR